MELKILRQILVYKYTYDVFLGVNGRFLQFQKHHNFAYLFSKFSESTFYKVISNFQ